MSLLVLVRTSSELEAVGHRSNAWPSECLDAPRGLSVESAQEHEHGREPHPLVKARGEGRARRSSARNVLLSKEGLTVARATGLAGVAGAKFSARAVEFALDLLDPVEMGLQ